MLSYLLLSLVAIQIGAVTVCMYLARKWEQLHWFIVFIILDIISISQFAVLYSRHFA